MNTSKILYAILGLYTTKRKKEMLPNQDIHTNQPEQLVVLPIPGDDLMCPTGSPSTTIVLILAYCLAILRVVTPLLKRVEKQE